MGNALWTGVRLKDVLDRAGVKAGAVAVRFNGLDQPVVGNAPDFMKSLAIDHAGDGEVMVAYGMNGAQLPRTSTVWTENYLRKPNLIFGGVFLIWRRPARSWNSSTEKFCNPNGEDANTR